MLRKILIVDDQVDVQNLLEATLRRGEYKIFKAGNGAEAVEIATKFKPDLIIMDITMPNSINGCEATRILKSNPDTRDCHIVILTGREGPADRMMAAEAGAEAYFTKPFSPLELLTTIDDLLGLE
jgi:two-component system, OmpR family, phosphate regulon response regulator PhoB